MLHHDMEQMQCFANPSDGAIFSSSRRETLGGATQQVLNPFSCTRVKMLAIAPTPRLKSRSSLDLWQFLSLGVQAPDIFRKATKVVNLTGMGSVL